MDYDLAHRLKNAGFPQQQPLSSGGYFIGGRAGPMYAASLLELIRACGPGVVSLTREGHDAWQATYSEEQDWSRARGSTAPEAVAHLWLVLQRWKH